MPSEVLVGRGLGATPLSQGGGPGCLTPGHCSLDPAVETGRRRHWALLHRLSLGTPGPRFPHQSRHSGSAWDTGLGPGQGPGAQLLPALHLSRAQTVFPVSINYDRVNISVLENSRFQAIAFLIDWLAFKI